MKMSLLFLVAIIYALSCSSDMGNRRTSASPLPDSTASTAVIDTPSLSPSPSASAAPTAGAYKKPADYNFRFVAVDTGINNPSKDRRSYFRIFIDKIEAGRTAIALESQEKVFEASLDLKRHLITVEKFVLDERKGRFVKLNNIEQPKPDFTYFNIPADKIVIVKMTQAPGKGAVYTSEFERE